MINWNEKKCLLVPLKQINLKNNLASLSQSTERQRNFELKACFELNVHQTNSKSFCQNLSMKRWYPVNKQR